MPENKLMYLGVVLIVAAVSVWVGSELALRAQWTVPYVGGAGVLFVVLGAVLEAWKARRRDSPAERE